jgi:RimJ/RimL family protein N-acetyltransferase
MSTNEQPKIVTERLILRPFTLADAPQVVLLVNDYDIAAMTLMIPHPYHEEMATEWIVTHEGGYLKRELANFAITLKDDGGLIGAVGLEIVMEHVRAGLGYWIGKEFWGKGYATEAAKAVLEFGFDTLKLNRIHGDHFADNPASGRVLQKIEMVNEGYLRRHVIRFGEYKDLVQYGMVKRKR